MIIGDRGDHGNAEAKHGQHHRGQDPVATTVRRRRIGFVDFPWLFFLLYVRGVIALAAGLAGAPVRTIGIDCRRALSTGSSEGAIPAGNVSGSKLMSVAGLNSSAST